MNKTIPAAIVLPFLLQACFYGLVNDAQTGAGVSTATVQVVSGSCFGPGCVGSPVSTQTNSSGYYVFDAYGVTGNPAQLIVPAFGQEANELKIVKPGFISRTIYHRPDYQTISYGSQDFSVTRVAQVYLCAVGSVDSDGDSICDDAEARYGTDPNNTDTDGDSLSDAAELFGYNGVDLGYFGASPLHKDVFLEMDYYPGLKPADSAIQQVVDAYANAPVSNPDGVNGINLILDLDDQIAVADADSDLNPVWSEFDVIKNKYFPQRREPIFHYGLFVNQYNSSGSSGISRGIPAHDFIVSLGTWSTPGGTPLQQAGTLIHELGHNMGLRHGGNQNTNYKPNYLSTMSYSYQLRGLRIDGVDGNIDYSRLQIASVNENFLNEFAAFAPVSPTTEADLAHYGVRNGSTWLVGNASMNLDFDRDGVIEFFVSADLDGDGFSNDIFAESWDDWNNLVYSGAGTIGDDNLGIAVKDSASFGLIIVHERDAEYCMTEYE